MCKYYLNNLPCDSGEYCCFAHGESDLRAPSELVDININPTPQKLYIYKPVPQNYYIPQLPPQPPQPQPQEVNFYRYKQPQILRINYYNTGNVVANKNNIRNNRSDSLTEITERIENVGLGNFTSFR